MRGRRERELDAPFQREGGLGIAIRAWRHYRGMTVTDLAFRAGFGKTGRGYISKIEHNQIRRLGEEPLAAIAQALDLSPLDLQQGRMPETRESRTPDKETLDNAIAGCKAWLKVYHPKDSPPTDNPLDRARIYLELAELCWARIELAEGEEERNRLLKDAFDAIKQALPLFDKKAEDSYQEAKRRYAMIEKEMQLKDLDDAIAGGNALVKVFRQEERPLDWARAHIRLAHLYWDRARKTGQTEERRDWLEKALQSIDQALPLFDKHDARQTHQQVEHMRADIEAEKHEIVYPSA